MPRHPHLPEGRAPGPQTRRGRRAVVILVPVFVIIGAGLTALAFVEKGGAGIGLAAVILLGLAAWLVLRGRRPSARGMTIALSQLEVGRGGQVRARVNGGEEAGLVCTVRYDVMSGSGQQQSRTTERAVAFAEWQPLLADPGPHELVFDVPFDAPFSHEGKAVTFAWAVSVRRAVAGRRDPRTDEPLWVLP